jgi:hydrogenase expression/formation protein HypE
MAQKEDMHLDPAVSCAIPIFEHRTVTLAHGGGGKLTHSMLREVFLPQFRNEILDVLHDGAIFTLNGQRLAFTTDSFIVDPIFFPGGDIGTLAIDGTVNDLAVCGATPMYISAAFIIEEGLPMEDLRRIAVSMRNAAHDAGVAIVTGDTKVVDHGKGDKVFINTAGLGVIEMGIDIDPRKARLGDKVIINGPIGAHGIAIISVREGLEFETQVQSDVAPLSHLVKVILDKSRNVHVLRDPTRGGIATALNEIAGQSRVGISLNEVDIQISEEVRAACEILGLDPLYVANEGKVLVFTAPQDAGVILDTLRSHPLGKEAAIIGEVVSDHPGIVVMRSRIGGSRVVDMLSGEQLPRIC